MRAALRLHPAVGAATSEQALSAVTHDAVRGVRVGCVYVLGTAHCFQFLANTIAGLGVRSEFELGVKVALCDISTNAVSVAFALRRHELANATRVAQCSQRALRTLGALTVDGAARRDGLVLTVVGASRAFTDSPWLAVLLCRQVETPSAECERRFAIIVAALALVSIMLSA